MECKQWSGSRYRLSALKKGCHPYRERTLFYENITNENAVPVIVTLIEEEIGFSKAFP